MYFFPVLKFVHSSVLFSVTSQVSRKKKDARVEKILFPSATQRRPQRKHGQQRCARLSKKTCHFNRDSVLELELIDELDVCFVQRLEQLVTGHTDGSMAHCEGLQERIGAAFGVSGYQKAEKQPATNMHWHPSPVRCMSFASDR